MATNLKRRVDAIERRIPAPEVRPIETLKDALEALDALIAEAEREREGTADNDAERVEGDMTAAERLAALERLLDEIDEQEAADTAQLRVSEEKT